MALIQVLIALELKLNVDDRDFRNRKFSVRIYIHFEPVDDFDFLQVTDSTITLDSSAMPGMPQIGAISSTDAFESGDGLSLQQSATSTPELPSTGTSSTNDTNAPSPRVCVDFMRILPSGHCQSMTTNLSISREAIESSKETKRVRLPLRNNVAEVAPVSTDAYREYDLYTVLICDANSVAAS